MTRRTRWAVRLLMLAVVAAVVMVVRTSLNVRKPAPASSPTPEAAVETPPPAGTDMWLSGFDYQRFDADGRATVIKAASYLGQDQDEIRLRQVQVDFVYMAKGKPGKTHIVADEAVMTPKISKGDFKGHVVLTTEEPIPTRSGETTKGFELRTEQLIYRGDKGIARTEAPVTFRRKDVSGSSRGLVYNAEAGTATFPAEAYVRIDDENVGPTQIHSSRASLDREKGVMKFEEGVRMNHGAETLVSKTLIVGYAEEDLSISRFQAIDDVVLNVSGSTVLPGTKTSLMGKGSRTIRAKRLFALFRPDRTLEEVTAVDDAQLVLTPPPGDAADLSTLKGGALGFVFDQKGQLTELQATKGASFVTQPKTGAGLRIDSQRLLVNIDPPTGSMKSMQFDRDVNLVRGTQKATSARARFDLVNNTLDLLDGPRMIDASDGSDLVANSISLETKTQNLKARNNVRQTVKPAQAADSPFGSASAPTVITGATLEYDGAQHRATYRGGVLLRSGTDEIRSKELALQDAGPGQRILKANGQVSATMGTKDVGAETKDGKPTAMQSRSETLEYDEAKRTLRYTGDVTLLLGLLRTRSPRAEVLLADGGQAVQELRAGEPVDAYQEKRQAKGEKLVYVPAEKSVTLTGKLVSFKDLEREMQGKSLTFFLGDDRIIVDGRERGRTETLIRPKESPKP